MARLAPLSQFAARAVEKMFSAPYDGPARSLYLESRALELLTAQLATTGDGGRSAAAVGPRTLKKIIVARDFLDANFQNPPSLVRLAHIAGTNEFTLKKAFKQVFGITVFAYIRQRRMEMAAHELQQGRTVSDVSLDVGYRCPRCFADAFRRHFGVLPSVARSSSQALAPLRPG